MLPKFFIKSLSLFTFLQTSLLTLLNFMGLSHILEPHQICWPDPDPEFRPVSASIIQEMLPAVIKYAHLASSDPPDQDCAVCLYEFRDHEEIRRLTNCSHIFHRVCLDRWMDHDQITCPLCRTPFVPFEFMDTFHEKLRAAVVAASAIPEFGGEFSVINNFV